MSRESEETAKWSVHYDQERRRRYWRKRGCSDLWIDTKPWEPVKSETVIGKTYFYSAEWETSLWNEEEIRDLKLPVSKPPPGWKGDSTLLVDLHRAKQSVYTFVREQSFGYRMERQNRRGFKRVGIIEERADWDESKNQEIVRNFLSAADYFECVSLDTEEHCFRGRRACSQQGHDGCWIYPYLILGVPTGYVLLVRCDGRPDAVPKSIRDVLSNPRTIFVGDGAVGDLAKASLGISSKNRYEGSTSRFIQDLIDDPSYLATNGLHPRIRRDEGGTVACSGLGAQSWAVSMTDHKPYKNREAVWKRYPDAQAMKFPWGPYRHYGTIYHWSSKLEDYQKVYCCADAMTPLNITWIYGAHFEKFPANKDVGRAYRKLVLPEGRIPIKVAISEPTAGLSPGKGSEMKHDVQETENESAKDDERQLLGVGPEDEWGEDPSGDVDALLYPEEEDEKMDVDPTTERREKVSQEPEEVARKRVAVNESSPQPGTSAGTEPSLLEQGEPPAANETPGPAGDSAANPEASARPPRDYDRLVPVAEIEPDKLRQWAIRRGFSALTVRRIKQLKRDRYGEKPRLSEAAKAKQREYERKRRREAKLRRS